MANEHSKFQKSECPNIRCSTNCGECTIMRREGYLQALRWIRDTMVENYRLSKLGQHIYSRNGVHVEDAIDKEIIALEQEKYDEL